MGITLQNEDRSIAVVILRPAEDLTGRDRDVRTANIGDVRIWTTDGGPVTFNDVLEGAKVEIASGSGKLRGLFHFVS